MDTRSNSMVRSKDGSQHSNMPDSSLAALIDLPGDQTRIRAESPSPTVSEDEFLEKWLRSSSVGPCTNSGDCDTWWWHQDGSLY